MIIALDVTLGDILEIDKAGRNARSCDFEGMALALRIILFTPLLKKCKKLRKDMKCLLLDFKINIIPHMIKKLQILNI